MTGYFRASAQYNDWKGTAAADDADRTAFREYLVSKGLHDRDKEFLVGISMYSGENHGGEVSDFYVSAFFIDRTDFETADAWLKATPDPIPVRQVDLELSAVEFFGLFKRFSVMLSWRDLPLRGREYQST